MNPKILLLSFILLLQNLLFAQAKTDFVQIETNKVLCLYQFLENAAQKRATIPDYYDIINEEYKDDADFWKIVAGFNELDLEYSAKRDGYPDNRHNYLSTEDLIWITTSNSENIDDFSERIIGMLPHGTHIGLINAMKSIEPYYDKLVWDNEQANIAYMETQLSKYKDDIEELFLTASKFYGTNWDKQIPFKILLYPIPTERGTTIAIPKGNALICAFNAHNKNDYIGRLGVIIHEMCHILFLEQSKSKQHIIDSLFQNNPSQFKSLAYTYIDEGLATAIGNGWAYKQIHGELDTMTWYNDEYIDGFAHAIYPFVETYLDNNQSIDEAFINKAISKFGTTFPKALSEVALLVNNMNVYFNAEKESEINSVLMNFHQNFQLRSYSVAAPFDDQESIATFATQQQTKIFFINKHHEKSLEFLSTRFKDMKQGLKSNESFIHSFIDSETSSPIIVFNLIELAKASAGIEQLAKQEYLEYGSVNRIE